MLWLQLGEGLWLGNTAWSKHHRLQARKHASEREAIFRVGVICQSPSSLTGLCLLLQSRAKFTSSYAASLLILATYVTQVLVLLLPHVHPMCWKKSSSPVGNSYFRARKSAGRCWCWIRIPEFRERKFERKYVTVKKACVCNPETEEVRLYEKEHSVNVRR